MDVYPKQMEIASQNSICTRMFIAALFPVAERRKQTKCSSTKECGLYVQGHIVQPEKKW